MWWANSVDPEERNLKETSHLGLHCLQNCNPHPGNIQRCLCLKLSLVHKGEERITGETMYLIFIVYFIWEFNFTNKYKIK